MTTATTLATDALGSLGVVDPVEALESDDATFALRTLNRIVATMAADSLLSVATVYQSISLTAGDGDKTIGAAGEVAITKPTRIEVGGYVRWGTRDEPLTKLNRDQWAAISDKSAQGLPQYYYYEPTTAVLGTINFWPVPDGTYTAYIPLASRLTEFANLTTNYSLPEAVEEYLVTKLAIDLGPAYGREAPASVVARWRMAKKLVKRLNVRVPTLRLDELCALSSHPGDGIGSGGDGGGGDFLQVE